MDFRAKGDLLFKTKTETGQISLGDPGSLTTKLVITSVGEMLLGNDNPQDHYIDLRVTGSNFPLIQASGSTSLERIISIGDANSVGKNQLDTIFHVHGAPESKVNSKSSRLVSSFGGDVVVSGTLYVEKNIDLTGSLKIEGDIESKDSDLIITATNDIKLEADSDVTVKNDLVVTNNITGSHIKGDGLEISNVNKSSLWQFDGIDNSTGTPRNKYVMGEFIDGNTGIFMVDLKATIDESRIKGEPVLVYTPTTNTRLYDTYHEIERDSIGQVKFDDGSGTIGVKPIETERVESPEQLLISPK